MNIDVRNRRLRQIEVSGKLYEAEVIETPFREGIELRLELGGQYLCVSDRGLGEEEAVRLITEEIKRVNEIQ